MSNKEKFNAQIRPLKGCDTMRDMVLVLNFDDASSRAITRKLRSERILCKILPGDASLEEIKEQSPMGLLLAGGVKGETPVDLDGRLLESGIPLLALGDAAALVLTALGGAAGGPALQNAVARLEYQACPLLSGLEDGERMLPCAREMQLPAAATAICREGETVIGFSSDVLPLYAVQFEVEQNDPEGCRMLHLVGRRRFRGPGGGGDRPRGGRGHGGVRHDGRAGQRRERAAGLSGAGRAAEMHICGYRAAAGK